MIRTCKAIVHSGEKGEKGQKLRQIPFLPPKSIIRMIKGIYMFGLGLVLVSCNDALNLHPKSDLTEGNFFNRTSDVELALVGCYDGLQEMSLSHDFVLMEMRSDVASSYMAEGEFGYIDKFVKDIVEAGDVYKYWKACFNALSRTNLVMDNLGIVTEESTRNRIEGEARFIRGLVYFNIVRLWGDIAIITRTVEASETDIFRRKPVADVYSQVIIPDLEFASANLPDMAKGRANATAAKALLSKVYLTLGRHGDAKTLLATIIDFSAPVNSKVAGVGLASDYASVFSENTKWNSEILFAVQFNASAGEGQTFSYEFSAFGGFTGLNTPTAPFVAESDLDPIRGAVNIIEETKGATYKVCGKYIKDGTIPSQSDNAADVPILRWADVLLMYTESVLGAPSDIYVNNSTNDPNAMSAYNAVRERAGYPAVGSVTRNELLQERKLEFAFENQRWFDLLRIAGPTETIRVMEAHGQDPQLTVKQKFTKVEAFQLLYPIPAREIRVLGKEILSQNAGYD